MLSTQCWENSDSFLNKGDQEKGIFEFYTEKSLSLNRHGQSWDLAQQNGMGWLCLVSCF